MKGTSTLMCYGNRILVICALAIAAFPHSGGALAQTPCLKTLDCAQAAVTAAAQAQGAVAALSDKLAALQARFDKLQSAYGVLNDKLVRGTKTAAQNVSIDGDNGNLLAASCPDGYFLGSLRITKQSGGSAAGNSIVALTGECRLIVP